MINAYKDTLLYSLRKTGTTIEDPGKYFALGELAAYENNMEMANAGLILYSL